MGPARTELFYPAAPTLARTQLSILGSGYVGTTITACFAEPGQQSFRLSFLLSIPAAVRRGLLGIADGGGIPAVSPVDGGIVLAVTVAVGYLTNGVLVSLVRRVVFWGICVGLGGLAILGDVLVAVI